ncbi:MAG TPA: hypothetical protein VM778_07395 [Gemmatimonadota bacterium]|nr:hypothetical protein [Gemmatimonadota bacterium]
MSSGTRVVLLLLAVALALALLRTLCVPVGSFRAALDELAWGMPADSVESLLGRPNRICLTPDAGHLTLPAGVDPASVEGATAERWVYSERPPPDDTPRDAGPGCRPPPAATELGFDASGRLRWLVRETLQTPAEIGPGI